MQNCSLDVALAALQSDATAGIPVVINLAPGLYLLDNTPFTFDSRTRASDVRLVGSFGTTLQAAAPNASLFKVDVGSPTVTLVGLQLRSQVAIDSGALNVQNCIFEESSAELGGALQVKGGSLAVEHTMFEGCKATRGGAALVSGGMAIFSSCTFKGCTASEEKGGGAVWVELSGSVVLRERTLLHDNYAAGLLDSIHIAGAGDVHYVLPAPLAHYIDFTRDGLAAADYGGRSAIALKVGKPYRNYPSACAPGVYGNSYVALEQSSGLCSNLCPAGYVCGASATVTPTSCELGGYCREGSSAARPCPAGRFGNLTGLISANECHACPAGSACGIGATTDVSCNPGTFAANDLSASCSSCEEGFYQGAAGATACFKCEAGHRCPQGSVVQIPITCEGGSYLDITLDTCVDVPSGSYAPAGSREPVACPSWGFCPGRENDEENSLPGSIPIVIPDGKQSEAQTRVVEQTYNQTVLQLPLEVEVQDSTAVNETAIRVQVSLTLGVPLEAISIRLYPTSLRRHLGVTVRFTIIIAEVAILSNTNTTVSGLAATWTNTPVLQLSEALGLNVTTAPTAVIGSQLQTKNVTNAQVVLVDCSPGNRGVNGDCIPVRCHPASTALSS